MSGPKVPSAILLESATTAVLTVMFGAVLASFYYWLITGAYSSWELQVFGGVVGLLGSAMTIYFLSRNPLGAADPADGARFLGFMIAMLSVTMLGLLFGLFGATSLMPSASEVGKTLTQGQYNNLVWAANFMEVAFTAIGTWALGIFLYILYARFA